MYNFADRFLENLDDIVSGIRAWTKADHSQYFPIVCPHSSHALALHNGSLLSVIRIDGYMGQYFPDAFQELRAKWQAFLRNVANDKTSAGFDLFWSYEFDPEGMTGHTRSLREEMIEATARRGLDVRDILEEEADLYGTICARETQLLMIVTHIDSLSASERKAALAKGKHDRLSAPYGAGAQPMRIGLRALDAAHEQHVNRITTFLSTALMGYTYERLNCYDALHMMRSALMPVRTSAAWTPRLTMNDCAFRSTEQVKYSDRLSQDEEYPRDWTFIMPPPLNEQMVPDGMVDLGQYVVCGERTYAPMYVSELATDPAVLEELLRLCHARRLPVRLVYSLMSNSDQANYWNRLFASIFTFSATNRQIRKASEAMDAYKEANGAVFGYSVSVTTWAPTEVTYNEDGAAQYTIGAVQKRAGDLEALLQTWGGQQVDHIFGCSVEALFSATPGYSMPPQSPRAPQIELDILTQLPLMRPARLWEPGSAIWFRTREGVLSPFQPMSSRQSSMIQLVLGGMGYGKSNFISENVFFLANHPNASMTPYVRGIDFGASTAGVVDIIKQSLPDDRKHEAVFEMFSANGKMVKNLFDTMLGARYPVETHMSFLRSWMTILCDGLVDGAGGVENLIAVISAAIERAYEIRDPRHQLFEPILYDPNTADAVVRQAVERVEMDLDEFTHYWEVVDALIAWGLRYKDESVMYAAKVAQRYCVPKFSDLITACSQLTEQFKSMPDVGGKPLVDAVVNSLMNANRLFPVFTGVTNTDISESRICIFDLSEAFGRGTTEYDDWKRSVYFSVVYRLLTEDLFVNRELTGAELEGNRTKLNLSAPLLEYHIKKLEDQDQVIKAFMADEVHRLGAVRGALDIIDGMGMEGRKYRVGLLLGTQMAQHLPEKMLSLATSVFIFGANQSGKLAKELQGLFDLTDDEAKSLVDITPPNAEKGAEVFVIHRVDSGVQRMKLNFQLGTIKRWAYATNGNERSLRRILYEEGRSTSWARAVLAKHVPNANKAIAAKQASSGGQLSENEAIRAIADELLKQDQ